MTELERTLSTARTAVATTAAKAARWASQATGRGSGGMIGGLVALAIAPNLMQDLGSGRATSLVTGTNGKSTTTRMLAAALRTRGEITTNDGGDNMDAGIVAALLGSTAPDTVLEVDELHVPGAADKLSPQALVLLNLTRDQLDRVGEINLIERRLRAAVDAHPEMTVIANCDDVLVTSAAFDAAKVVWVAAGAAWAGDSAGCPRTGAAIYRDGEDWHSPETLPCGRTFTRPEPDYVLTDIHTDPNGSSAVLHAPDGQSVELHLQLPGRANLGNAAQAVAAAVVAGIPLAEAAAAVGTVAAVAGRYDTYHYGAHEVHTLLAKNPAGWQEALSMIDRSAGSVVIATNAQIADGEDLSWLWDVFFEHFDDLEVIATGERAADLSVRLSYAGVEHRTIDDPLAAIAACPPGQVEVLANYTAFRDLTRDLKRAAAEAGEK